MRRIVYSPGTNRLVYLAAKATPELRFEHWRAESKPTDSRQDDGNVRVTATYLPAGAHGAWFSPYRRSKARRQGYACRDFASEPPDFYQFALRREEVAAALDRHGFILRRWRGLAPEISMQEDMVSLKRPVHWLFASRGSPIERALRRLVCNSVVGYCRNSFMAIARRRSHSNPDGAR